MDDPLQIAYAIAACTCLAIGLYCLVRSMGALRSKRMKFPDMFETDAPLFKRQPEDYKWKPAMDGKPRPHHHSAPFELAPDSMEKQVEAVLAATPVERRPRYHNEPINIGLGYDQWGNNPYLLHPDDKAYIDRVGINRAGGDVTCEHCGYKYYDHPPVQGALYLHRVCDREPMGRLVKL